MFLFCIEFFETETDCNDYQYNFSRQSPVHLLADQWRRAIKKTRDSVSAPARFLAVRPQCVIRDGILAARDRDCGRRLLPAVTLTFDPWQLSAPPLPPPYRRRVGFSPPACDQRRNPPPGFTDWAIQRASAAASSGRVTKQTAGGEDERLPRCASRCPFVLCIWLGLQIQTLLF